QVTLAMATCLSDESRVGCPAPVTAPPPGLQVIVAHGVATLTTSSLESHSLVSWDWTFSGSDCNVPDLAWSTTCPVRPFSLSRPELLSSLMTLSVSVCGRLNVSL